MLSGRTRPSLYATADHGKLKAYFAGTIVFAEFMLSKRS